MSLDVLFTASAKYSPGRGRSASILLKALALTLRLKYRLGLLAKVTIPSKHI